VLTYADSSAVVSWLLDQPGGSEAHRILRESTRVSCSVLTLFECDRTLTRTAASGAISDAAEVRARSIIDVAAAAWSVADVTREVLATARRRFPREPVRALDALHLATALVLRASAPDLVVVTLDHRLAENASLLGFEVLPRGPASPAR
jgi:predicted nucleic acid-binding protein